MDISVDRDQLEAWLILVRAPGLGPAALRVLIGRHGSAAAALDALRGGHADARVDAATREALRNPDATLLASDLDWLAAPDHRLLRFDEADFPALLEEIPSPPAALFVAGDPSHLWRPQVAIVGSRAASPGGLANAARFASALAASGFAITSGLADGIDGAAHRAALAAGQVTIAVLGTGADRVYPAKHRSLAAEVAAGGALVTEFAPGTPGRAEHFPQRNRIIAGLALGTLVVEAGLRSGSLITARLAGEAGREVFAIPGSIHNPLSRGCHQLIRSGATLVESSDEIIAQLAPMARVLGDKIRQNLGMSPNVPANAVESVRNVVPRPDREDDPEYRRLRDALGHDPVGVDQLAERTGLAAAVLSSMLLMLELEGEVVAGAGATYTRAPSP
jgi:DNA processing protein